MQVETLPSTPISLDSLLSMLNISEPIFLKDLDKKITTPDHPFKGFTIFTYLQSRVDSTFPGTQLTKKGKQLFLNSISLNP